MKNKFVFLLLIVIKFIFSQDIKTSYRVFYKNELNPFTFIENKYLHVPYLKIEYKNISNKPYYFFNSYSKQTFSFRLDLETSMEANRIAERKFNKDIQNGIIPEKIPDIFSIYYVTKATDKNWDYITKKWINDSLKKRYDDIILYGDTFFLKKETYTNIFQYVILSDIIIKQHLLSQYKTGKRFKYFNGKGEVIKINNFVKYIPYEIIQKEYLSKSLEDIYKQAEKYFIFLNPHERKIVNVNLLPLYLLGDSYNITITPQKSSKFLSTDFKTEKDINAYENYQGYRFYEGYLGNKKKLYLRFNNKEIYYDKSVITE